MRAIAAAPQTSTPVQRPRNSRNNIRNEARHPADINRKRNVIISSIRENLDEGDRYGVEKVLNIIECGDLLLNIEEH